MNVLEVFAGIGGLSLGLERAGMKIVGHVEIDPFAQGVLRTHWPEVPIHDDVRTTLAWWGSKRRPRVHVLAGGFPCQGHSVAGRRRGTDDERWGWPWMREVIEGLDPPIVLIENVPNLVRTGLVDVLEDLAGLGFDAWWNRVPAAALGAPHLRWRLILVAAHPGRVHLRDEPGWERGADGEDPTVTGVDGATWTLADTDGSELIGRSGVRGERTRRAEPSNGRSALADSKRVTGGARRAGDTGQGARGRNPGRSGVGQDVADTECEVGRPKARNANTRTGRQAVRGRSKEPGRRGDSLANADRPGRRPRGGLEPTGPPAVGAGWWPPEPDVGRVAHGIPARVDRLRTLGNAVVPQVAEYIGRRIITHFTIRNRRPWHEAIR